MSLNLYSFFHLNIAYSAIEEEDRPHVIEKCYWPLLKLVAKHDFKFGIELSAYTLETILSIDPKWIKEFSRLILKGSCELIGCGYSQIIGPLVPAEITIKNLAEKIKKVIDYQGELIFDTSMPDGNPRKLIDSQKINNLGWEPSIDLDEGLKITYSWFLENN